MPCPMQTGRKTKRIGEGGSKNCVCKTLNLTRILQTMGKFDVVIIYFSFFSEFPRCTKCIFCLLWLSNFAKLSISMLSNEKVLRSPEQVANVLMTVKLF